MKCCRHIYACLPTLFTCQAIGLKNRRDWVLRSLLRLQVTSSRQETDISMLSRFHPFSLAEKADLTMSGLIRRSHNAPGGSGLFNFEQLKIGPILRCRLKMHLSSKLQGLINVEVPLTQYVWCLRVARSSRFMKYVTGSNETTEMHDTFYFPQEC